MSTSASQTIDLSPAPDLHPLYATVPQVSQQIGRDSGFDPAQKAELIAHCLTRACIFGDIGVVQYLLSDSQAQSYIDLGLRDDDGVSLISLTIHGFGGDSDRDVEREECVRLLVSQGADLGPDNGALNRQNLMKGVVQDIYYRRVDTTALCCPIITSNTGVVSHDPRMLSIRTYGAKVDPT